MERIKNLYKRIESTYKRIESTLENYLVMTLLMVVLAGIALVNEIINAYRKTEIQNVKGCILVIILLYLIIKLYKAIILEMRRERKMQEIRKSMQKRKNERQKNSDRTAEIIPFPNKLVRIILRVKQYVD